jgi:FHS family Na+ dependent glucose MFS transporter 1
MNWLRTAVYFLIFITIGLASAIIGPTLPNLAANTQTALSEIGFLFTARSLGFMIGSLFGSRLFDKIPGHWLLAVTVIMMSATLGLIPVIGHIWLLTAVLLLLGVAENMVDVGCNTFITWIHRDNVSPFINALHFFFGIGAFLSPIVVAQVLLRSDGISGAYWLLALVIFPVSLLVGFLPSPTAVHQQTDEQTNQSINYRLIILVMAFLFLYVGVEIGFGGWVFTYAIQTKLVEETAAAYLTSAFWGALTVGRLVAIPLAARLRPSTVLRIDLIGALLSIGLIIIWPNSATVLWLGAIGLGFCFASIFPTTIALAERRMPLTGKITGWIFIGAGLGSMTIPWLMGYLLESVAATAVLWIILLGLILAMGLLWLIVRHEKVQDAAFT